MNCFEKIIKRALQKFVIQCKKSWYKVFVHLLLQRLADSVLSLCKHACKEVCGVKQGVDPYPLLARSCDRWWPDFETFTACKRSIFGFKRGKKAQCISNRCKDLFKRKKYFGDMGTLIITWQDSLEANPSDLIGSSLVGISPYSPFPLKRS